MGFKPWDLTEAGVTRENGWRDLAAKGWDYPNWEQDSKPWPTPPFDLPLETFESMKPGTCTLVRSESHVENKGDSIGCSTEAASPIPISENPGAASKRSLILQDAPGLSVQWSPFFAVNTGWKSGEIHVAFDIMARADEKWLFELRDANKTGYLTGLGIGWKNGNLSARGPGTEKATLAVAADQWVRVEIQSTIGSAEYALTLTRQDGEKATFPHLPCPPQWTAAGYLVWISLGETKTAMFLDNLRIYER